MKNLLLLLLLGIVFIGCKEKSKGWMGCTWCPDTCVVKFYDGFMGENRNIIKQTMSCDCAYGKVIRLSDTGFIYIDTAKSLRSISTAGTIEVDTTSGLEYKWETSDMPLTFPAGSVKLGGALTQNTTIEKVLPIRNKRQHAGGKDTIPNPYFWNPNKLDLKMIIPDESYFSIVDSTGNFVAVRNNRTKKWQITDCEKTLETIFILDSIMRSKPPIKEANSGVFYLATDKDGYIIDDTKNYDFAIDSSNVGDDWVVTISDKEWVIAQRIKGKWIFFAPERVAEYLYGKLKSKQ